MTQQIGNSQLVDTWAAEGPIVEPDITKVDEGWQLGEQPPHEWMNYLQNLFGRQVNYLIQSGISEWNSTDEQPAGVFKRHNGKVWRAVNTTTNSEPSDANANWAALASEEYVDNLVGGQQFSAYSDTRTYSTGDIVQGSDGKFYEFYDRDQTGTVQGTDPTDPLNRPHIWMEWDGVRPGATIEWRSETLPEGYIENVGDDISRADYRRIFAAWGTTYGAGDGATTFGTPDDRGEFKRGWDNGRGVDAGRGLAQHQMDAMQRITGAINAATSSSNIPLLSASTGAFTSTSPDPGLSGVSGGGADRFKTAEFDSANSPDARTDDSTYPRNNAVIYLTKI